MQIPRVLRIVPAMMGFSLLISLPPALEATPAFPPQSAAETIRSANSVAPGFRPAEVHRRTMEEALRHTAPTLPRRAAGYPRSGWGRHVAAEVTSRSETPGATAEDAPLTARLAAIEKALEAKRQELHVPGAALIIVKDDRVIYQKGFGLRDVDRKLPVTPETLFAIGSTTKAFTALAVMMSAEEGKLSLADPPKKYLPYFKLRDPEADSKITLSDLLCHRSGLPGTDLAWYTGVLRPREVIQAVGLAQSTAKLGEKFQYQNVMFLAAGEVVARVQKTSWHQFLARRIFQPLGMTATNTSKRTMQRSADHALGYNYDADTKQTTPLPMRELSNIAPASAINSNVRDLAQWLRLLLNRGVYADRRLVTENGFNELFAKHISLPAGGYGYGWFLDEWHGHAIAAHGGGIDGFNAQVALMPDQKLGFALLTNISASPLPQLVTTLVWDNLVGNPQKPDDAPAGVTTAAAPAADAAAEVGTYHLEAVKLDAVITLKEGKLAVQVAGQPEVTLENVGGRRYKVNPPAPPGLFVTFRPTKADAKETELFFEQPGGVSFVLSRQKPPAFTAPLSVEALMQQVIAATGGEANLRKHHAMSTTFTLDLENQGLTGKGVGYARAPNAVAETWTLYAADRKIATARDYFDGTRGGSQTSFASPSDLSAKALPDAALTADFYPELNWQKLFKSVTIQGLSKVGEEEVYQVVKTPEKGSPVTDYVSTRSFLLLKRDATVGVFGLAASPPISETYRDYRAVDGVMVPFTRVRSLPEFGNVVVTVKEVKFDGRVPDAVFRARSKKHD